MKKTAFFLLTIFSCYAQDKSACTDPAVCLAPVQMTLSHNFGKGVGHKGYSSADLFFIKDYRSDFHPFVDLRFHMMDEGRVAFNTGVGFRQLVRQDALSVGANLYYDYRNSYKLKSSQMGAGIELLSQHVDFRLNGYAVFSGKKQSDHLKFASFSGNQINVKRKTRYAFSSANAEIGIPLTWMNTKSFTSYIGIGPYYLFGETVSGNRYPSSWGGKFRVDLDITDYVGLKFELNHDRIFHTTCQGVIAINIPLYKKTACSTSCSTAGREAYLKRTLRPVMRNEIIPVKKESKESKLRDGNGDVIQAFFVNNLAACPGLGTFESPFCALTSGNSAPAGPVLIYVFEGNSPLAPYTGGFIMKDGQTLQGSGTALNLGGIIIPPQTSGSPVITSPAAPAVTVASSTTVQGLTIQSTGAGQFGIGGTNVSNVQILNNKISQSDGRGINLTNQTGFVSIMGNRVEDAALGGIFVSLNDPTGVGYIGQNTVNNSLTNFDIETQVAQGTMTIADNHVSSAAPFGIIALDGKQLILNNVVNNTGINAVGILYDLIGIGITSAESYIYTNNVNVTDTGSVGIRSSAFTTAGTLYTEVIGNTVLSANPTAGIVVETLALGGPSFICASVTGNTSNSIIRVDGQQGPVNVQQTFAEFTNENNGTTQVFNTVNFDSGCTAP